MSSGSLDPVFMQKRSCLIISDSSSKKLMRKMGLEPTQYCYHKILSLARLPVPTLPHLFSCCCSHNDVYDTK